MKSIFLSRMRCKRSYLTLFLILMLPVLSVSIVWQTGQMQKNPLSFADIIYVLRSKKVSLSYRNKLLTDAVKERGIDFTLIEEFAMELLKNGASPELIDQIRQKSPKPEIISAPIPNRVKETQTTPDSAFYKKRADDYIAKGEYKRAIADYDEAIRLNPQDAAAYYNRGFAYHHINSRVQAFENYKTAILIKNELAIQPATQCVLYDLTKNVTARKAIEDCTKTINLGAGFALAFYIRGNAYLTQEEPELAIADYNKFIEFDPKNVLAYLNRGDAYWDKEDYDRAAADYNKAIELDSSNEIAKKNLQRLQAELLSISTNRRKLPASSERINTLQVISHGELNSRAIKLIMPKYPPEAERMHIQGKVKVQITIDESGNVISAKANSGNGILRFSAEIAARRSKFEPISVNDQTVKANGFIVYNFILP